MAPFFVSVLPCFGEYGTTDTPITSHIQPGLRVSVKCMIVPTDLFSYQT